MRIIGGRLRGRRYQVKTDRSVKPISGRIKQSLFDILRPRLAGARVLDLFAGTGAVGIEALSRGAASAFFVDSSRRMVAALEKTLEATRLADRGRARAGDALGDLSWIPHRGGEAAFDIVFMGPPYRDEENRPLAYTAKALARVVEASLLAPGGLIVAQHHVKEPVEPPPGLKRVRQAKYGDSFLDFFEKE